MPIFVASCSSSSSPSVLGGGEGVDTGTTSYDGSVTYLDTGTTPGDAGTAADALDAGQGPECATGLTSCNGVACVDLTTNPNNCGTCFNVCTGSANIESCCASKCVDNSTDPNNCGSCGVVCEAGMSCVSAMCR